MESSSSPTKTLLLKLNSIGNLEDVIESDPDQLQYWYEQLGDLDVDVVETERDLALVCNAMRLVMAYEHTNAEELKDIAEREAVEMAEKEENWELERDMLKEEISGLRERITSKAGIDETNEAFRAEIDSLSAENSYLKQQARERDREASDTRDKVEELSSKLEQLEKEKQLYISQQLQLEDSIRELNRRLSTKSDAPQRTEWETKKLRQRNEQALVLSNQLQNVISQNDKLKEQVESLTSALSSSKKQADLGDQLTFADKTIEKLLCENQELKQQLSEKEGVLTESLQKVDLSSKEYLSLLQSKDAHIEELRTSLQKQMVETEELAARLVTEGGDTEERDKELDKLRMELVQATEAARKLFTDFSLPASGDGREEGKMAMEAQLRVRLLQLDQEVDGLRERLKMAGDEKRELECTCEQKDLANARLSAENQRIRKMAFGDAETEVHRLEMQLKFRDSQIERLNRMCSLLQIELQEYKEEGGGEEGAVKKRRKSRLPKLDEPAPKKKPRSDEETQAELVGGGSSGNVEEAFTILSRRVEEDKRQDEVAGEIKLELEVADEPKGTEEEDLMKPLYFVKPQTREELEANAVLINSLYTELRNLIRELEESRKEVETERLMKSESQKQLLSAKLAEAKAGDELDAMRTSLLGDRASTDDEDALGSRIEALEIELMELRRMEENLKLAGTERERRIAESTRRLIYLAIENAQLNRRTEASKRLRTVLGEEISRLNSRLRRLVAGDGARARQLMVENEINLIEIARLQQSLLHSVPLSEYKRLSREHKYLLAKETIAGAEGEHVKLLEEDDQVDQSQFDISKSAAYFSVADHSADELMKRNRRLDEMNSVLEEQNLSWKAENQRLVTEVGELEAFLDDIESQSDMKSMIVNIERRFLQAISGQLSFAEEGASTEREVARLNEQLRNSRTEWRRERTQLVNVIIQMARQNRHLHAMTPIIPITNQQLASFKRSLESVMESEAQVEKRLRELADAESQLAERRAVVESTWSSIQTLVENDFQLEYIRTSLQGYQLSVITLTGELNATKKELAKYKGSNEELVAELGELRDELNQFHFSNVELSLWRDVAGGEFASASPDRAPKSRPIQRDGDDVGEEAHDRGESVEWDEANEGASEPVRHQDPGEVSPEMESPRHVQAMPERSSDELEVIADTTHGQIEEERQTALELCIQNYKEQLERKDQSIEEYRELVETFQMQLLTTAAVTGGVEDEAGRGRHISRQTKSADEIVGTDHRIEERDKRIIAMEVELCELTASNGELADRLQQLIKSKREERRRTMLEVGVQADFSTDTRTVNSPANMDEREDEKGSVLAQQQAPEESKSNSSDEEDVEGEDEEDTDSGTVEDMEQQATSSRPPHIRRTSSRSSLEESKREKASTSTTLRKRPSSAAPAAAKASAGREEEELVLKHRSEVRRLRMRIAALERKNKQFMEENMALKERSRRYPLTRRVYEPGEESNLLVRDNDRLTRENRNLAKTLKERKEELEELQKQLKRTQTGARTRVSVDGWEERKRLEQTITGLKSKLVECEARESTLKDRLERHERHIELMNKNQASRYVDMERFNKLAREWREEKALLEERESAMRSELQSWPERYRDASFRLEMLMKENKSLHSRVETLHYEMEERSIRQRMPSLISASVQTGVDLVKKRDAAMQVESQEKRKAADAIADKQLRRAELMVQETKQELGTLRTEYDKLLRDYNRLLVLKSKSNDEELEKIASMELLRDKLAAKDTEIGHQRHVIMELEKRLWQFQLDH